MTPTGRVRPIGRLTVLKTEPPTTSGCGGSNPSSSATQFVICNKKAFYSNKRKVNAVNEWDPLLTDKETRDRLKSLLDRLPDYLTHREALLKAVEDGKAKDAVDVLNVYLDEITRCGGILMVIARGEDDTIAIGHNS